MPDCNFTRGRVSSQVLPCNFFRSFSKISPDRCLWRSISLRKLHIFHNLSTEWNREFSPALIKTKNILEIFLVSLKSISNTLKSTYRSSSPELFCKKAIFIKKLFLIKKNFTKNFRVAFLKSAFGRETVSISGFFFLYHLAIPKYYHEDIKEASISLKVLVNFCRVIFQYQLTFVWWFWENMKSLFFLSVHLTHYFLKYQENETPIFNTLQKI